MTEGRKSAVSLGILDPEREVLQIQLKIIFDMKLKFVCEALSLYLLQFDPTFSIFLEL